MLGTSVSLIDAEVHWREFFASLKECGMYGLKMITKDVARDIRSIFNEPDRAEADRRLKIVVEKYRKEMPRLAD